MTEPSTPTAPTPSPEIVLKVIAIDGPAGAGKSSVSQGLATSLGFIRLDTGALYRAIGLAALRAKVQATEGEHLTLLLKGIEVRLEHEQLFLNGQHEEESLRTPEVSKAASDFAKLPSVREKLLQLQRKIGMSSPCIVDGRDIGTIVFPDAPLKIYLTASADVRAHRRLVELNERGVQADFEHTKNEIIARDLQDQNREIAPLKCAEDARVIDATELTLKQVVAQCFALAQATFNLKS
jgi:CMP/dCMP kinase